MHNGRINETTSNRSPVTILPGCMTQSIQSDCGDPMRADEAPPAPADNGRSHTRRSVGILCGCLMLLTLVAPWEIRRTYSLVDTDPPGLGHRDFSMSWDVYWGAGTDRASRIVLVAMWLVGCLSIAAATFLRTGPRPWGLSDSVVYRHRSSDHRSQVRQLAVFIDPAQLGGTGRDCAVPPRDGRRAGDRALARIRGADATPDEAADARGRMARGRSNSPRSWFSRGSSGTR